MKSTTEELEIKKKELENKIALRDSDINKLKDLFEKYQLAKEEIPIITLDFYLHIKI